MDKLRSYKLSEVAKHYKLDVLKDDVGGYGAIWGLFHGTPQQRGQLVKYCCKDVEVTVQLIRKRQMILNLVAASQIKLLRARDVLTRGQNFSYARAIRHVMRDEYVTPEYFRDDNFIPPPYRESVLSVEIFKRKGYDGAHVFEPTPGLHRQPVATFDYASLYPSIMRSHNLSPDTFVPCRAYEMRHGLYDSEVSEAPNGARFVRETTRPGLLPMLLKRLLDRRAAVKKLMETEKDPVKWSVLNAQQNELKVMVSRTSL